MTVATQLCNDESIALITQMRAGTHYLCAALRVALGADVLRPVEGGRYAPMSDDELRKGLRADAPVPMPAPAGARSIYFAHYYHPHLQALRAMRRVFLIGFPFDSFYSDGIVYSDPHSANDPSPSATRPHAPSYRLRFDSPEWRLLEPSMRKNAAWLGEIEEDARSLILRYEDFFLDFEATTTRLARFLGGSSASLPRPVKNARRSYWSEQYAEAFDSAALTVLWEIFAPAIEKFYPERLQSLRAAL